MSEATEGMDAGGSARGGRGLRWLDALAAILSLVGLFDAIYLTVEHMAGRSVRCALVSGCSEVLASSYASVGGQPVALFGVAAYFTAFSLATLIAFDYERLRPLLLLLSALMFLASLWFLYLQAFVLRAFCQYCLLSAATSTLLFLAVCLSSFMRRRP